MNPAFRFDEATVATLKKILTDRVFLDVRGALERAAIWVTPPGTRQADTARQKRAKQRLHSLMPTAIAAAKQLDPYTRCRIEQMLAGEFGLRAAELQRLMIYMMVLTRPSPRHPPSARSLFPRLTAIAVAAALQGAGISLGTAERSKFGRVLSLVLRAGDRSRWGTDVRKLQKYAVTTMGGIPPDFELGG